MDERRKYFRLKNGVQIEYKLLEQINSEKLEAVDIGGGGVRLHISDHLQAGALLELSLLLPEDKETFYAFARVAWQKPEAKKDHEGKEYFETGIEFLKMNLKDRLQIIHYVHTGMNKLNTVQKKPDTSPHQS